ncbi:MAG: hypothetical protein OEZ68_09330 [Gammaproteobacteria bacterium]|nr:hypothetical protein [Gammaproteobacteria bacterium]MDH5800990.1 hypothetical protein [Gammaproteobacteria bacterium]
MLKKLNQRIKNAMNERLYQFATRFERLYQILSISLAVVGHLFLYSFPLLVLGSLLLILSQSLPLSIPAMITIGICLGIMAFGIFISYRIATIKFQTPEGLAIEPGKAQELFQVIAEVEDAYKLVQVHKLVISDSYNIELLKTPRNGFPYLSHNTLVVGLPLAQTLSPEYFAIAVRRKLIQYSKRHNPIINWVNQLRHVWPLYARAFKKRGAVGDQLIHWFFSGFSRFYEFFTRRCVQLDELHADKGALDMVNAEELLKTIETMLISETFLNSKYWPNVLNAARKNPKAAPPPFNKISEMVRNTLAGMDKSKWLVMHLSKEAMKIHKGTKAPFKARMAELGCSSVEEPEVMKQCAAQYYFGENYPKIVMVMNKQWLTRAFRSVKPVVPLQKPPTKQTKVAPAAALAAGKK